MRTTSLGPEGPQIGVIGLGCMGFTYGYDMDTPRNEEQSITVIRHALELGSTLIDTADVYGPYTSEQLVGKALRGHRDQAVLATKVGMVDTSGNTHDDPANRSMNIDGSPEHIRTSIDASLRRLQTEHVDLYQLHRVDPKVPLEESWAAMAEVVKQGKARAIGLSAVTVEQIRLAQAIHPVATVQNELSLWTRNDTRDVVPFSQEHNITYLAYTPLARGFFSGRISSVDDVPTRDRRREVGGFTSEAIDANQQIITGLRAVAARHDASPAQVALAWCVAQGARIVPIPGTKTMRYVEENAGAGHLTLTREDLADLDALPAPVL